MSLTVPTPQPALAHGLETPLQVVDPNGNRVANELLDPYLGDIDSEALTDLYVDMSVVRRFDDEAFALTRQGELALWPPLKGQEAAQVGAVRGVRDTDFMFGTYREHAVPVLRGVDQGRFMQVWKTGAYAGWDPHEHKIATPQIIIGAQSLHAVGYAMAASLDGSDDIAVGFFGDGATSEGDVNEAMVFASAYKAPVVLFCQNNQYAISEPVLVQADYPIALRATGFGILSLRVDGNDVLAVLAATRMAADRARSGEGPTFIEAVTYRMGPHTTTDDPKRYRGDDEVEAWKQRDPLQRIEALLAGSGAVMDHVHEEAKIRSDSTAKALRKAVTTAQTPPVETMFDNVYANPTKRIERQRAQHLALLESFAGESK